MARQVVVRNITAERNAKAVIAGAAPEIIRNTGACTRLLTSPGQFDSEQLVNLYENHLTNHFSFNVHI